MNPQDNRPLVFAVIALAAGAVVALSFLRPTKAPAEPVGGSGGRSAVCPQMDGQIRGICMQLSDGCDLQPYDKFINEAADTGANAILFSLSGYQENCGSSSIFVDARMTPPERRLHELVKVAHDRGMKVILMPIVLLENGRKDEWRGTIDPEKDHNSWDDWWEDYTNYILRYAGIGRAAKVDMLMVGSELVSTEGQTERWERLIHRVREQFPGLLSYSANWDHYKNIAWWDKLDVVGMTTYYTLSTSEKPTYEELKSSWTKIHKDLVEWQAKIGKPLLFTEVGFPNQKTCAKEPWNYYGAPKSPDPELQKMCFQSFFEVWSCEPALGGYLVWEWRGDDRWVTDPDSDTSYCPREKPAMKVIEADFARPNGPGARTTASRPATTQPASQP